MSLPASLDEFRAMVRAENAAMLEAAFQMMESTTDTRMTTYESRISKEVKRTEKALADGNQC